MPLSMKIQPIDFNTPEEMMRIDSVKPMAKSRLKRFFDFPSILRNSTAVLEKVVDEEPHFQKDGFNGSIMVMPMVAAEFEPSSVCLDSIVQIFIKENNNNNDDKKQSCVVRCGRNRCNCFNRNCIDSSSEDEWDSFGDSNYSSSTEACEILKVKTTKLKRKYSK